MRRRGYKPARPGQTACRVGMDTRIMTSSQTAGAETAAPRWATAALVLADGAVFWGKGVGAARQAVGEVCFNTSMTGYQEIITDPSYAGQIITFTFPHVGNVGTNVEDIESINPAAPAGGGGGRATPPTPPPGALPSRSMIG